MEAQQELFSWLYTHIRDLGYDTYDSALPPSTVPYPFVYLGELTGVDVNYKNAIGGEVTQTIHFWSNNVRKRGELSEMMFNVKNLCRGLTFGKNFTWLMSGMTQQILPDTTTSEPLLHGIMSVTFKFT